MNPGDLDLLHHRIRPSASAVPEGALILFHGRGAHEGDLFPLLDVFDPDRRLVGITPRAPLSLPPGGYHWYVSAGIPTPDRDSFLKTYAMVSRWLESVSAQFKVPASATILGGFSQGTVMTFAMGLGKPRPRPAGLLAFSGFLPEVDGFELDFERCRGLPVAMGHGTLDTVIPVGWSRQAKQRLEAAGAEVMYQESEMPHSIDPSFASRIPDWIRSLFPTGDPGRAAL